MKRLLSYIALTLSLSMLLVPFEFAAIIFIISILLVFCDFLIFLKNETTIPKN